MAGLVVALGMGPGLWMTGCDADAPEPRVYQVEKEPPPVPGQTQSMAAQTLPDNLVATGDLPAWDLPEGWRREADRPLRKATFSAGEAEVSITAFPGGVGGLAANVNRWRTQLGLTAEPDAAVEASLTTVDTPSGPARIVSISNGKEATLGAILPQGNDTWFFKMTGPEATVRAQDAVFRGFVASIRFGDAR